MKHAVLAVALVALAACSGGDDSSADTTAPAAPATAETQSSTPVETTVPAGDTEGASPTTSAAPVADVEADVEAGADEPPPSTVPLIDGVEASIELITPPTAGEIRPLLEWSSVDGASYYLATLYGPDGRPYWTWTGPTTSVHVGGEPKLGDDVPGPSVVAGMTWGVVALDDGLVPIALSHRGPIGP